jgi:rhomboid protease GluP
MALLILLGALGVILFRVTTAGERRDLLCAVIAYAGHLLKRASRREPGWAPFFDALRGRTRQPVVTPAIAAVLLLVFLLCAWDEGALGDPETLLAWGGSAGPQTTNGQWWRLVTAMFVHTGALALLANLIGFAPVGLLLERLVGHVAFAAVFTAAGVFASLVSLVVDPVGVSAGASGAVSGVYGLLLAWSIRGLFPRSPVTMPFGLARRFAPAAGIFVLFNAFAGGVPLAGEVSGLLVGISAGAVLTKGAAERKPSARRIAATAGAAVVMALVCAIPLRGIVNVRPVVAAIVSAEARAAEAYRTDVRKFRNGQISEEVLIALIEKSVLPDLRGLRERLMGLGRVPGRDAWLASAASRYLDLREQSWRTRAEALQRGSLRMLQQAEAAEREALAALGTLEGARR